MRAVLLFSGGNDSLRARELLGESVLFVVRTPGLLSEWEDLRQLVRGWEAWWVDWPREVLLRVKKKRCLACRAFMYLAAERLARELGLSAIATGEIAGSKASQTVDNLLALSRLVGLPVLRPLYGLEKERREEAVSGKCPFVPRRPATRPGDLPGLVQRLGLRELVGGLTFHRF